MDFLKQILTEKGALTPPKPPKPPKPPTPPTTSSLRKKAKKDKKDKSDDDSFPGEEKKKDLNPNEDPHHKYRFKHRHDTKSSDDAEEAPEAEESDEAEKTHKSEHVKDDVAAVEDEEDFPGEEDTETEFQSDETDDNLEKNIDDIVDTATENPDKQGNVRTVPGAHLVYKRKNEMGTYDELWIFPSSEIKNSLKIRNAILSGTDIPPNKTTSPDDKSSYNVWSAGNCELMNITGLPN